MNRTPSRVWPRLAPVLLILLLAALAVSAPAQQTQQVEDRGVQKRMDTMNAARSALIPLNQMMAGRVRFNSASAGIARKQLIRATRAIPDRFRRPHGDPLSKADPQIWTQWADFKSRARTARNAAKGLNTNTLNGLRKSLPPVVQACLSCHRSYRIPAP